MSNNSSASPSELVSLNWLSPVIFLNFFFSFCGGSSENSLSVPEVYRSFVRFTIIAGEIQHMCYVEFCESNIKSTGNISV